MSSIRPLAKALLLFVGLGLLVAACSQTKQAICPKVAILDRTSKLTVFGPGAQSADNIQWAGEMKNIKVKCSYQDDTYRVMEADVSVDMILRKGPAMQGDSVTFNYFVIVTDRRGKVLRKRIFPSTVNFGGARAVTRREDSWQLYNLARGLGGAAYEIWVGYQLTPAQLEYNRKTD